MHNKSGLEVIGYGADTYNTVFNLITMLHRSYLAKNYTVAPFTTALQNRYFFELAEAISSTFLCAAFMPVASQCIRTQSSRQYLFIMLLEST